MHGGFVPVAVAFEYEPCEIVTRKVCVGGTPEAKRDEREKDLSA